MSLLAIGVAGLALAQSPAQTQPERSDPAAPGAKDANAP